MSEKRTVFFLKEAIKEQAIFKSGALEWNDTIGNSFDSKINSMKTEMEELIASIIPEKHKKLRDAMMADETGDPYWAEKVLENYLCNNPKNKACMPDDTQLDVAWKANIILIRIRLFYEDYKKYFNDRLYLSGLVGEAFSLGEDCRNIYLEMHEKRIIENIKFNANREQKKVLQAFKNPTNRQVWKEYLEYRKNSKNSDRGAAKRIANQTGIKYNTIRANIKKIKDYQKKQEPYIDNLIKGLISDSEKAT